MMDMVVQKALTDKIQWLESRNSRLEHELRVAHGSTIETMLGPLRLRQAVMLYIGEQDVSQFIDVIKEELSEEIARDVLRHLFILNNAPLSNEQKTALRAAFNNGMNRW